MEMHRVDSIAIQTNIITLFVNRVEKLLIFTIRFWMKWSLWHNRLQALKSVIIVWKFTGDVKAAKEQKQENISACKYIPIHQRNPKAHQCFWIPLITGVIHCSFSFFFSSR